MTVTQLSQNMINNPFTQTNMIRSSDSSFKTGENSETKLNFQKVMELTKNKFSEKTLPETPMTDYPLEYYALPSWFGAYIPEKATLSAELNHDYWELAIKLSADNIFTEEENNQLKNYLLNDPFHKAELEKSSFQAEFRKEIGEYFDFLSSTFQDVMKKNDIDSIEEYYQNVILDKEKSEAMHMDSCLKNNSRILELMDMLLS